LKKRILWIDYARAFGMILIIIGHSLGQRVFTLGGSMTFMVNVTIFFVVSGYLFKARSFQLQVKKLFNNLILPYLFTSFIFAGISFVTNHYGLTYLFKSMGSVRDVLLRAFWGLGTGSNVIFTHVHALSIGAIWFLPALFFASVLFNLLSKIFPNTTNGFYMMGSVILIIALLGFYTTKFGQIPWSINAAFVGVLFMWVGLFIKRTEVIEKHPILCLVFGLIFWIVGAKFGYFWLNIAHADNVPMAILGGAGGSIAIMAGCLLFEKEIKAKKITRLFEPLSFFGNFSLIVLCVHIVELNSTNLAQLFMQRLPSSLTSVWVIIVLVIYRILLTGIITYIIRYMPIFKQVYVYRDFPFKVK
jgi:fucose 4-O-acetylase-like acetyltransferase